MARVQVHARIVLRCGQTATRVYPTGYRGPAPREHIARIVAAGKGERIASEGRRDGA